MVNDISAVEKDMYSGDPGRIDQAYAKTVQEIFAAAGFGDHIGAKHEYRQPKYKFDVFGDEWYGSESHYQPENR